MKATELDWIWATANLNIRRRSYGSNNDRVHTPPSVNVYKLHIEKCGYGESVLDVGCGSQEIKKQLPENVKYYGLDAFPIQGYDCIEEAIEDFTDLKVDTCFAFAVLDNCREFFKACENMKTIAQKNIGILTGIDIDVDQFHTFKLQLEDFDKAFSDWKCTHREQVSKVPNVWLLNYERI